MSFSNNFNKIQNEIASMYLERDEQVRGLILAILAREHVLLLGPPGTAKSATICELASRVTGANMFERLLTPFSAPEEVFGPVSIQGLQQDRFERIITGFLPDAHVGFVDEVFKANSAILNSLLTIMAERKFSNGRNTLKTPLFSLVGASNETPQEDNLSAMYDRFMLRFISNYVSASNVVALLRPGTTQPGARSTISLSDLQAAQAEVDTVSVADEVLEQVARLKIETEKEALKASDRRWRASIRLLKACAYLDGRDKVSNDDLIIYSNVLWDSMQDANKCASIVGRLVNPEMTQLVEHADAIEKILAEYIAEGSSEQAGINMITKVRQHREALNKLKAGEKGEKIKQRIAERVEQTVKQVLTGMK